MKIVTILAGLCLVFVFVWERVDMVRVGYQVERLKHDKVALERERDELLVKVSVLSAPDRIAKVASEKLGLALLSHVGGGTSFCCSCCPVLA
jgi:cell division protein FtsL